MAPQGRSGVGGDVPSSTETKFEVKSDCRRRWYAAHPSITVGLSPGRGPGCGHPSTAFKAPPCPRLLDPWGLSFLSGSEPGWRLMGGEGRGPARRPPFCTHGNLTTCWIPRQAQPRRQPLWVLSLSRRNLWPLGMNIPDRWRLPPWPDCLAGARGH